MILIISKQKLDPSTDNVIDWLAFFGARFIRTNGESIYPGNKNIIEISINNHSFNLNDTETNVQAFRAGWFRRWSDKDYIRDLADSKLSNQVFLDLNNVLISDEHLIRSFYLKTIKVEKWLSEPSTTTVNKLNVLSYANSIDLQIPDTIICNQKNTLLKFINKHNRVITKDISFPFTVFGGNKKKASYTIEITNSVMKDIPNNFHPSLFQNLIEKKYEIRSFFIRGKFYSMAIFSQKDSKTMIDFRNYNREKPNRCVPYQLPLNIQEKLKKLMKHLSLDTGSIDLIKDTDGNIIFLEVNPVGQFGMTSKPCNYRLEKLIAETLIKTR